MSTNTTSKSFTTTIAAFLIALTTLTTMTATQDAKAYTIESPWAGKAKIRPGQMSGDLKTDKFIDYFIPFGGNSDSLFFLDLRGRTDDIDTDEFNIGLGYRSLFGADKYIVGINAYYDEKKTALGNKFRQGGLGVEVLTQYFDGRINYYEPTGSSSKRLYENDIYSFGSSELFISYGYEEALKGMDFEAGFLVPFISNIMETRIYGGIYDFNSDIDTNKNKEGTKYRLELRPSNLLTINFERYDDKGKDGTTNDIAGAYLNLPFSLERLFSGDNPFSPANEKFTFFKGTRLLRVRMTDAVVRDRDVVTAAYTEDTLRHVKDIIYVNGDNTGGAGKLNDPYESLDLAVTDSLWGDNTIIYITSTDAIADTYINNITLSSGMELWSSSYLHPIYNLGGTGAGTIIDGSGGTIITLADDNSIIGLTLTNGDFGIYGSGTYDIDPAVDTLIYNALIDGNNITSMTNSGIYIENLYDGTEDLNNLTFDINVTNNIIDSNNAYGAYINHNLKTTGTIDSTTIDNNIAGNSFDNNNIGLALYNILFTNESATNTNFTNNITGNSADLNSSYGMYLDSYVRAEADYVDSTVSSNTIELSGSTVNNINGNSASNNNNTGIYVYRNGMTNYFLPSSVTIDESIFMITSGTVLNSFTGNTTSSNIGDGININASGLYTYPSLNNVDMTGDFTATSRGAITNYFESNTALSNSRNGIATTIGIGYRVEGNFYGGSTFNGNITLNSVDSTLEETFINNQTNNNNMNGIYLDSQYLVNETRFISSTIDGNITSKTENAKLTRTFSGNTSEGNTLSGIDLTGSVIYANTYANSNSTIVGDITSNIASSIITNTFTSNNSSTNTLDGIHIGLNSIDSRASVDNSDLTGTLKASSDNSIIENVFDSNITNTNDFGIQVETNYLFSTATATNNSAVTGDITTTLNNNAIVNTFTSNISSGNNASGLILGGPSISSPGNNIYSRAYIENSILTATNTTDGNFNSLTESSTITNNFTNNITSGNGASGMEVYSNVILSNTDIGVSGTIEGDTTSSVQSSEITNNLSSNYSTNNSGDGIILRNNELQTYLAEDVTSSITGSINTDVTATTITFNVNNNSSLTNLNDGLYIATIAVPSLTGSTTIDINATGNEIENNGRYGVFLGHVGSAIYDGDLNTNSLANNATFDLNNQTGETIDATNNWWGLDTDPGVAGFTNLSPVEYTPWRSAK